jgi:hypothetical protein
VFHIKVVEKLKTDILCLKTSSLENLEKYYRAVQAKLRLQRPQSGL